LARLGLDGFMLTPCYAKSRLGGWRRRLHVIIFESDTRAGKAFDIGLSAAILLSLVVVMLDCMPALRNSASIAVRIFSHKSAH
jgi:hypothetical protein